MSSSSSGNNAAVAPESVSQAIASFGAGELSLLEVRQQIIVALEEGPDCAEAIHELLDEELKSRTLTIADYGELVGVMRAVVSENVPTEFSDGTPGESGEYRIVEEGTMMLAGGEVLIQEDAADELPESDEQTRPFGEELPESDEQTRPFGEELPESDEQTRPFGEELPEPLAEVDDIEPGTVLRDRYRLDEEVARGAMGVVYRAVDLIKLDAGAADPQLAVKVVSPEFAGDEKALRAFQNEVTNTQHLSHPRIIHLFELDRDNDRHFITMEWLEGESLAALLDGSRGSALEQAQTYAIIEQLCDALIYAHEHNVVHADVKPGNVFLLTTGEVKLIDFGIAKSELELPGNDDNDAVALTPAYASCERLEKADPTPQDDLYSLACLIYRLLAGRRVFGPLTALEAEAQQAEVVPIGGMDDQRWTALAKALSFRREDRQAGIAEFADQFGRRLLPRDTEEDDQADTVTDETAQLPILNAAVADLVAAEELQPDMEVDFAFEEENAAKSAIQTPDEETPDEEIVLETAPAKETITLDELTGKFDQDQLESGEPDEESPLVSEPAVVQLAQETAPAESKVATGQTSQQIQLLAGIAGVLLVIGIAAVGLFSGDEQPVAASPAELPQVTEPQPAAELLAVEADVDAELAQPYQMDTTADPLVVETGTEANVEDSTVPQLVVEEPVIEAAVTDELAIEQSVVEETVVEEPVAEETVVEEPAVAATVVEEPVISEPVAETVTADEPLVEEVVADSAVSADVAVAEAAAVDAIEAVSDELAGNEQVVEQTTVAQSVNQEPVGQESAAEQAPVSATVVAQAPAEPVFDPRQPVLFSKLELIKYVEPKFPRTTGDRTYDGWVDVEYRIGADGKPRNIEVIGSSLPRRFEAPSINAVKKWRFEPYVVNGVAVAIYSGVRLRFSN